LQASGNNNTKLVEVVTSSPGLLQINNFAWTPDQARGGITPGARAQKIASTTLTMTMIYHISRGDPETILKQVQHRAQDDGLIFRVILHL
jgi:hypothetical protein